MIYFQILHYNSEVLHKVDAKNYEMRFYGLCNANSQINPS